ncbi:MAG: methionyl-tRNA formyltransferase [Planctomycetes bacterium]|nr:methionyl-tRNA formyltransferase [Planctomycetota bacterium]
MRTALFGTSEFAVPALDALAASCHEVCLVVTPPDRPKGRGRKVEPSPVAERARAFSLPLFQPPRINSVESVERLRAAALDLVVVAAYGQILGRTMLALPRKGTVNLHGSVLPAWRGAAPIARAIQAGEEKGGVTLQYVVLEVDAGDVIDVERTEIAADETAGELSARLAVLGARVLLRNIDLIEAGEAPRTPQDHAAATHAPQLEKDEGRIPWEKSAKRVRDHVRAMTPWPAAYTHLPRKGGLPERIIVRRSEVVESGAPQVMPGTVIRASDELVVGTGYGSLRILRLLRAGRQEADAASFLRGFPLEEGARLL